MTQTIRINNMPPNLNKYRNIPLTKGKNAIVDECDYEELIKTKWLYDYHGYACRRYVKGEDSHLMHRIILNAPPDLQVDHINGDRLDNRRSNLRLCTISENQMNRKKTRGASIYKGVHQRKDTNRWCAYIGGNKTRRIYLGCFDTEAEAAKAYNNKAVELFGEFASLNDVGGGSLG